MVTQEVVPTKSLEHLRSEIIASAKRGYPILLSGALFFLVLAYLPLILPMTIVRLLWIFGLMVIFPLGILLGRILRVNVITTNNPLGTLGGLIAGTQTFFIPVFILVYQFKPEYLPFTIGILGGGHFLAYMWLYESRAYLFVTLGTSISSFVLGSGFLTMAYTLVPLAIASVYIIGVLWIFQENRQKR